MYLKILLLDNNEKALRLNIKCKTLCSCSTSEKAFKTAESVTNFLVNGFSDHKLICFVRCLDRGLVDF